jgi:hypothetical protein
MSQMTDSPLFTKSTAKNAFELTMQSIPVTIVTSPYERTRAKAHTLLTHGLVENTASPLKEHENSQVTDTTTPN